MTGCCRCCALAGCALPDGWLLPLLRSCCASWLAPACAGRLLRCWLLLAGTAGVRCGRAAMGPGAMPLSGGC
jgi:hypothetical protein